jgi:hypothetical protein
MEKLLTSRVYGYAFAGIVLIEVGSPSSVSISVQPVASLTVDKIGRSAVSHRAGSSGPNLSMVQTRERRDRRSDLTHV